MCERQGAPRSLWRQLNERLSAAPQSKAPEELLRKIGWDQGRGWEAVGQLLVAKSTLELLMKKFWDKPNPPGKSKKLSPRDRAWAKARAKAAGRRYPNLVDNAAAARR